MPAMTHRIAFGLAAMTPLIAACGVGFDERSGGDAGRGDARPVVLETLSYDRISAEDGDNTDWKSFKLTEPGKVTVNVWWDEPGRIKASVEVRDQFGNSIDALKHQSGEAQEKLGPLKLAEGTYFVRFLANDGASVYSYEIIVGSAGKKPSGPDL
ncbi:MAG: hypothetical protein JNJ59_00645 [Deltaproteobacteria bacterium]|nr:hypothetical protein [Deltaproteobacteria bacterium]